ncbi:unnamed protein product [Oppiella nova]|uniref:Ubiquitin-like domain-containing protein n=1 Tax=Oppiella nova TaxID=334625 RepID=A0A7R9LR43_9ACAR|nr:unnamed protein product [Oppiella nova]CAG2166099.1 unnamed protein product [Oppiella nova]
MSLNIFYKSPLSGRTVCLQMDGSQGVHQLAQRVSHLESIPDHEFKLYSNGRRLTDTSQLMDGSVIAVHMDLMGGKGGFGSMLRAIGAQIEKTTNREACRDLTGRRLRDINEEKRIKEWIKKEAQRKEEMEERRRQKLAKMAAKPKAEFNDLEFERLRSEIPDIVDEALQYGLRQRELQSAGSSGGDGAGSSGTQRAVTQKRKTDNLRAKSKKKKKLSLWVGVDDVDVSSDSDVGADDNETITREPMPSSSVSSATEESNESSRLTTDELKSGDNESDAKNASEESTTDFSTQLSDDKTSDEVVETVMSSAPTEPEVTTSDSVAEPIASTSSEAPKEAVVYEPLDLMAYESVDQLESLGLDRLKHALTALGLKCGGTLTERANRLLSIRGLDTKDIPKKLWAKKK